MTVWAYRSVQNYTRRETVRVQTALVNPSTAPALLRALQTAPDKHAYRIPDTSDDEYSSDLPGFELTPWIEPNAYGDGLDGRDPYAGVHFPPHRPTSVLDGLDRLSPDVDMRLWREEEGEVVLSSRVWDNSDGGKRTMGTRGEELIANRNWLASQLHQLNRWLLVEVEFERHMENSRSRTDPSSPGDDDRLSYLQPYTKYFLVDTTGAIHDLRS